MPACLSELKIKPKSLPMGLLKVLHALVPMVLQSAQLFRLFSRPQFLILHHVALWLTLQPGHFPFLNLGHSPQYNPQKDTNSEIDLFSIMNRLIDYYCT